MEENRKRKRKTKNESRKNKKQTTKKPTKEERRESGQRTSFIVVRCHGLATHEGTYHTTGLFERQIFGLQREREREEQRLRLER